MTYYFLAYYILCIDLILYRSEHDSNLTATNVYYYLFLFLVLVYLLQGNEAASTKVCYLTQEPDPDEGNRLRWIQPFKDMCSCTSIRPGGLFKVAPNRKTKPIYTDQVIFTDDKEEIHDHYGCHFHGKWF